MTDRIFNYIKENKEPIELLFNHISGYAGIILDYQFHGTPEISEKEVKKALMRYYSPLQEKNKGWKPWKEIFG